MPSPPEKLSETLRGLLRDSGQEGMTVEEVVGALRGQGLYLLVIFLSLPFLTPVTIPGISLPFGAAIAFCGLRVAFGKQPWLPRWILRKRLSRATLERMARIGVAFHGKIERFIRPRASFLLEGPGRSVAGAAVAVAGFYLSLPIPPPFPLTNTLPGIVLILLCLGLTERDGWLVAAGYAVLAVATAYLALIAAVGGVGAAQAWKWLSGG